MQFDPANKIVQRCAKGMSLEGEAKTGEAYHQFQQAWNEASNDFEKFVAAHYMARHQNSVREKLKWDETALQHAIKIGEDSMKSHYPSLYLNIAKCHEDLGDSELAYLNYRKALTFADSLPGDGYGKMIKTGIDNGIERVLRVS